MSKIKALKSIEVSINYTFNRLTKIHGLDKVSLQNEFKEWIESIESDHKSYDVLFLKKIKPS